LIDLTKETTLSGFIATIILVGITVFRQRRFEASDLGSFGAAYFSGSNVPPAIYLFLYAFDPDPISAQTKLHGYEKYVAFAGLSLLILSLVTFWSLCRKAYEVTIEKRQEEFKAVEEAPNPL
jgi:hypothetical protein